eukprot:comp23218_c0_seq3/m.37824 comp23218_c0_seq3/g.37824  ORF comp23218_c0_seq3/g.37824 comp23218_c0_seq3/m.37824 type:complete len:446 (-) comp23218_c0_seq3:472-1809(-)
MKELKKELEGSKVALLKLQQEHGLLQTRAQELRTIPDLRAKLGSAQQQLNNANTELDKLRKRGRELEEELTFVTEEAEKLREERDTATATEHSLQMAMEELKVGQKKEVEGLEQCHTETIARMKNEARETAQRHAEEIRKIRQEVASKVAQIGEEKSNHVEEMEIKFQQEISLLTQRLEDEQKKAARLSQKLHADLEDAEQRMADELSAFQKKNSELERQMRTRSAKSKEVILELEAQLEGARATIGKLQADQQVLERRLESLLAVQTDYVLHSQILQEQLVKTQEQQEARLTWELDEDVDECRGCAQGFSALRRKHHCRACGKIYCWECSSIQTDPDTRKEVRLCKGCVSSRARLVKRFVTTPEGSRPLSVGERSPSLSMTSLSSNRRTTMSAVEVSTPESQRSSRRATSRGDDISLDGSSSRRQRTTNRTQRPMSYNPSRSQP